MNQKKSFVLYFDAEDSLRQLCASQRGELLSALFDYARCIETEPVEPAVYAARCPNLRSGARMAFCFMASAIARDIVSSNASSAGTDTAIPRAWATASSAACLSASTSFRNSGASKDA